MSQNKQQLTNIVTILAAVAVSVWAWWWTSSNVLLMAIKMNTCMLEMHLTSGMRCSTVICGICAITCTHGIGHLASTLCLGRWRLCWDAQLVSCAQQSHLALVSRLVCPSTFKDRSSAAIPLLVLCTPAVYGTLVRFEPNLANIAWVAAGVLCLVNSQHFQNRNWIRLWAVCLGVGVNDRPPFCGFFSGSSCRAVHFGLAVILRVFIETCLRPSALF